MSSSNEHLIEANNFTRKANEETENASHRRGLRRISESNESNSNINSKEMSTEHFFTELIELRS